MRHRLEATFDQRGIDCIAAAGADPEQTDRLLVDEGQRYKNVDRAANVLDPRRGVFGVARKPLAFPLEGWIENERRVALGGQLLHIKSTGLFFDADAWPYDNDGWILLVLGETIRQPKLTDKLATVALKVTRRFSIPIPPPGLCSLTELKFGSIVPIAPERR